MMVFWQWIKTLFSKQQLYMRYRDYALFKNLGAFDLFLLDERMHQRKFKKDEVIFETGYPLEVIYFVTSGEIRLQGMYYGSEEKIIGPCHYLGLLDMYHSEIRSSTAVAHTDVMVDAISQADLMDYIHARPRCGLKILHTVCKDFCDLIFEEAAKAE